MKKIFKTILLVMAFSGFCLPVANSQVPEGFNYQAVARNAAGEVIAGTDLTVRIAFVSDVNSTSVYWEEEHTVQTNDFGLFTIVVGDQSATWIGGTYSNFSDIEWAGNDIYLRPSIKQGAGSWQVMEPSLIASVPFAMLAKETESKQQLSLSGDNLLLSEGGSVSLTKYVNNPTQTITLTGDNLTLSGGGGTVNLNKYYDNTDNQSLSMSGDNLSLYNGGTVSLSKYNSPFAKDVDTLYRVGGSLSLGSNRPLKSKLAVVSTDDDSADPLFEVRRKDGQPVFSVYSTGVQIHVEPTSTKGPSRGGFAIGGFDAGKGDAFQNFFTVEPDSIRMFIKETDALKGPSRGGFAIGGFDESKGFVSNYFNVSAKSDIETYNDVAQMLWYPRKEAFLAGRILITGPADVGLNSTSLGYHSKAAGDFSQAFGHIAQATGDNSTAIGNGATASGPDSYAFGSGALATGLRSFAFGSVGIDDSGNPTSTKTEAAGDYSVALGMGARATVKGAMALGIGSYSYGSSSTSLGYYSTASASYSFGMGYRATAAGPYSTAIGYYASTGATGNYATALGSNANATGTSSLSLGYSADATSSYSVAMGYNAQSSNSYSTAIGYNANASMYATNAIGYRATASANYGTAIGYYATASGDNSYAIGRSAQASGGNSFSLGYNSSASGATSVSIGYSSEATASNSLAMGNDAVSAGINATAIGYQPRANGEKSISIGSHYSYSYTTLPYFNYTGKGDDDSKGDFILLPPVLIPLYRTITFNRANIADGKYSISFGNGNYSNNGGFALGSNNDATAFGAVAIGVSNIASNTNTFAAGYSNNATGYYGTAFGNSTYAKAYGSFVIGQYNIIQGDSTQWVETDPLFVIGNGVNADNRNNALTLYKNGRAIFKGTDAQVGFNDKAIYLYYNFITHTFTSSKVMYGIKSYINRADASVNTFYSGYFYDTGSAGSYGGFYADERSGGAIDVAEYIYDTYGDTEAADVVVADPKITESVVKSSVPFQASVVGVVSTKPHLTMGMELVIDEPTGEPIPGVKATRLALAGRVPVKVTDENGSIEPGDFLTTSSKAGYAMKWTALDLSNAKDFEELKTMMAENEKRRNAIIGKALESHKSGEGKIVVLITL